MLKYSVPVLVIITEMVILAEAVMLFYAIQGFR